MKNWDRPLEQKEMTLKLPRPSRLNPRLLVHLNMKGEFDLNGIRMAPKGTITLIQNNPHNRDTWALYIHGGPCVMPAMLHYR